MIRATLIHPGIAPARMPPGSAFHAPVLVGKLETETWAT